VFSALGFPFCWEGVTHPGPQLEKEWLKKVSSEPRNVVKHEEKVFG